MPLKLETWRTSVGGASIGATKFIDVVTYKLVYRTFDTKLQAQQWARRVEGEMGPGLSFNCLESERTTLRERSDSNSHGNA